MEPSKVNRRNFLFKGMSTVATLAAANTAVYMIGSMTKSLGGSLVAGAKTTFTACFVAGTEVTLADGNSKPIELVQVGEMILTYDENAKRRTVSPVEEVFHHESKLSELFTFHFAGTTLTSNDVHLIFLPRENRYQAAKEIYSRWARGEKLELLTKLNETAAITHIEKTSEDVPLYNLHVTSPYDASFDFSKGLGPAGHNYYANGALVHNVKMCGCGSSCHTCCDAAYFCENFGTVWCSDNGNIVTCTFGNQISIDNFNTCYSSQDFSCGGP